MTSSVFGFVFASSTTIPAGSPHTLAKFDFFIIRIALLFMMFFFRRSFSLILISLCFITFVSNTSAQSTFTNYNSTNSALPNNTIRDILIDSNSVKWIATDFGLASFNDSSWTIYQSSNSCFNTNSFRSLALDNQNRLWVGTFNDGVYIFKDSCITHYNTSNSGLPDDFVHSIAFDTSGAVWLATSGGLAILSDTSWSVFDLFNSPLSSNNISSLFNTKEDFMLIGTINGGLTRADTADTWTTFTTGNSNIPDNSILSIHVDTAGDYWFGSPAAGLMVYNSPSNIWLAINPNNSLLSSFTINDLVEGPSNRLLLATSDTGLVVRNGNHYTFIKAGNSGLPDNRLTKIVRELIDVYWIGTINNGIVKLDSSFTTGVQSVITLSSISVFPNPSNGNITIKSKDFEISKILIHDLIGRLVLNYNITHSSQSNVYLNLDLLPGIYTLTCQNVKKGSFTSKLLIE